MEEKTINVNSKSFQAVKGVLGIIGAGNFTKATVLPNLSKLNAKVKYIASSKGLSGTLASKKFNVQNSTTDYEEILADSEVDAVIITTQHNSHAKLVIESLQSGKHVFVEKPLAITDAELDEIITAYGKCERSISVGFNRRFSPFVKIAKEKIGHTRQTPIQVIANMNAGFIPSNHWTQDMEIGGGRIIGEACHLIDLITYLTDSLVDKVVFNAMGTNPSENTDNATLLLKYQNGSKWYN